MNSSIVLASLLALAAASCGGSSVHPTNDGWGKDRAVEEPPDATESLAEFPPGSAKGEPRGLKPGAPAAWWVWNDDTGVWHVRSTTAGGEHRFRGRVKAEKGKITETTPLAPELASRVKVVPEKGVVMDFDTKGDVNGIDFKTTDSACVRFHLLLDGGPHPKRIYIGAEAKEPPHSHFLLCP